MNESCPAAPAQANPRLAAGLLFVLSTALCALPAAYALGPGLAGVPAPSLAHPSLAHRGPAAGLPEISPENAVELIENSRDAGLLTDWHLLGRYGHGDDADFRRCFPPERWAAEESAEQAAKTETRHPEKHFHVRRYELLFPDGTFVLPPRLARRKGVFYALSSTYLDSSGDWNVYLESAAEAAVFVDGRLVLARGTHATGALRATIHADIGYHTVMVKFVAQSAPFRVAILPPSSGSQRKNSTPYLWRLSAPEDS